MTIEEVCDAIENICAIGERIELSGEAPPCADDSDRIYLHCAELSGIDYLVTFDHDLLDVGVQGGTQIVTPSGLLQVTRSTGEIANWCD